MEINKESFRFGFDVVARGQYPSLIKQVHGTQVFRWDAVKSPTSEVEADAIITPLRGRIWVSTADCVPVLVASPTEVAAIHAGWRGAIRGVVQKTFDQLEKISFVWVGPHIRVCCFEVQEDFLMTLRREAAAALPFVQVRNGRYFFSILDFLIQSVFPDYSISETSLEGMQCTRCGADRLPSFRRDRSTDPFIRSWIERK